MPDEVFDVRGVVRNSAAFAQRLSVLWPLAQRRSIAIDDVIEDTLWLQRAWRQRAELLKNEGWADLQGTGKLQFVRNCPPTLIKAFGEHAVRQCKLSYFCPWCYMHQVEVVFNKLANYLPERGALHRKRLPLLEVHGQMVISKRAAGKYLSGALMEWKTVPKKIIRQLSPLGAYYSITLAPAKHNGNYSAWRFNYHVLAVMPGEWTVPEWLDNTRRRVRLTSIQSKKQLINVVGRTCRYPQGLFFGDPRMTIMALNARKGKRCSEFVGCLRSNEGLHAN